jgi:hypothetical protein
MLRQYFKEYRPTIYPCGARYSAGGIATRYVLDGSGVEPQRVPLGPPCFLCGGYRAPPHGAKWPRCGVDHPSTPVWRRGWKWVERYRYLPFVPQLTCYGVTFAFKYCTTRWVTFLQYCFWRFLSVIGILPPLFQNKLVDSSCCQLSPRNISLRFYLSFTSWSRPTSFFQVINCKLQLSPLEGN